MAENKKFSEDQSSSLCPGNHEKKTTMVGFPPPVFPKNPFPVSFLGIDKDSYGFIHLATVESWRLYTNFMKDLRSTYLKAGEVIPYAEIEQGMFVIARVRRGASGFFVRAKVLSKNHSSHQICCKNVDECEDFCVPKEQIFFATQSALQHPRRGIKIQLAGLSRFLNTNLLQQACALLQREERYTAEVVGNIRYSPPMLRLTSPDGIDLSTILLQKLYRTLPKDSSFFTGQL